jgi:hypothetical protein
VELDGLSHGGLREASSLTNVSRLVGFDSAIILGTDLKLFSTEDTTSAYPEADLVFLP